MRRRAALGACAAAPWMSCPWAHAPFGRIDPPRPAKSWPLRLDDGSSQSLTSMLHGKVTAVQLMFTSCSAICPLQGALFAEVAKRLRRANASLLSLSIDPVNDDPKALSAWLHRFGASPASRTWRAASPRPQDLDGVLELFSSPGSTDRHSAQVGIFDSRGRMVYRTPELPPAAHVVELLDAAS